MSRLPSTAVALFAVALGVTACSSPPEQPILYQFFTSARLGDTTSLESFATTTLNAKTDGTVTSFTIASVSPERTAPLPLKGLGEALDQVKSEDAEFTKHKVEYQSANIDAIHRVLKAEAESTPIKGKDAEVQAAWTKWRTESSQMTRKVSEARNRLASQSTIVNLSLASPGTHVDPTKFDGDMVTKDVTVNASMKTPSGASVEKTLVVTMERAVLKGDKPISGRWIVTAVKDLSAPAGSKTS